MSSDNTQTEEGPSSPLSNAVSSLLESYQHNGFVGPICVLSQQEAQETLQEYMAWAKDTAENISGDLRFKPHLHLPFANRIAHHPNLVNAVKQVLRTPNVILWSSDFNIKGRKSEGYFAPHQDATYAGLEPANQCLTAWVALTDPVHEEQGCLCFWAGSHKSGQLPHVQDEKANNRNNMLSRKQRVLEFSNNESDTLEHRVVTMPLRGGEASLHHFYTLHQSGPNRSSQQRIGLALRYCASSVRQTGRVRESVTLISGHLEHDGFDLEPVLPLKGDISREDYQRGRDAHAEAMQRESANYFEGTKAIKGYDQTLEKTTTTT